MIGFRGGTENEGTVFKIGTDKQLKNIYSFIEKENRFTYGLVAGEDGLVYGTMSQGGTQNLGSIYKIDDEDNVITHFSFREESGSSPHNTLVSGPDGFLYGVSRNSADSTNSQVYKIHPDGRFSVIRRFTESLSNFPLSIFSDSQLLFWGSRRYSNTSTFTFTVPLILELKEEVGKREFLHDIRGRSPSSGLIKGSDSLFYGVTSSGGDQVASNGFDFGLGTLYSFDMNSKTLTTLHRFSDEDGTYPSGDLIEVDPGVFFGVTRNGGPN